MSPGGSLQTFSALMILDTVFHVLAFILTSFRLCFRYRIQRLWWDDFWAALALLCNAVGTVTIWLVTAPLSGSHIWLLSFPTQAQLRNTHIIAFWVGLITYTCSIWSARISIVLSVARIVPPSRSVVMMVYSASAAFICMWAYILISKTALCSLDKSWYNAIPIGCILPRWMALSEFGTDAVSDVILVVLPLHLLWRVKLPLNQKIMVLSVFSTSILVTVVSVAHTVYLFLHISMIAGGTAEIEGAVSVIVCNLLVIVTFVYRVITNGGDLTIGYSSNRLTTVDLDVSGGSLFASTAVATTMGSCQTGRSGGDESLGTYILSATLANSNDKEAGNHPGPTTDGSTIVPLSVTASIDTSLQVGTPI